MKLPRQANDRFCGTTHRQGLMNRRSLLKGVAALPLAYLITACQPQAPDIIIQLLGNSIPTALLREFQQTYPSQFIQFRVAETLASLYDSLTADNSPTPPSSVTASTLGDYWLTPAIQQNLITPLNIDTLEGWSRIPTALKELVTRDANGMPISDGQVWGAPYRWGSLALIYRVEAFQSLGWKPEDWSDLWRPELNQHLSLPDSPRIVIGLALKQLAQSLNAERIDNQSLAQHTQLSNTLNELHRQVKFYSSSDYLQPLILEDTWLAVGWSTDILPLLRRDRRFAGVIPASGTILTADVWVQPRDSASKLASSQEKTTPKPSPSPTEESGGDDANSNLSMNTILKSWIEFCWKPNIAQRLSLQGFAASPVLIEGDRNQLPASLRNDAVLLPEASIIKNSEFLLPLPDAVLKDYQQLWTSMRLDNSPQSE
ncbi:MAG: extracellular solute-binding protein [Cyanobacteria bacterium J06626_14]